MNANNNWPGKPGVPMNPERDGWHWLSAMYYDDPIGPPVACFWEAKLERWPRLQDKPGNYPVSRGFCYLGPVLLPDEAAALQARADRNAAGFARVDAEAERDKFLHKREVAALQKRCEEAERERDALRRDASQEIATDKLVRRLQHLGDWQAADRIEALQKRVAELEGALRNIEADCGSDCPPSHGAIKYAARAALGGKDV